MGTQQNTKIAKYILLFFAFFFMLWWVYLYQNNYNSQTLINGFGASYGLILILGASYGILNARKWGGFNSWLGKTMIFLSIGLLFEEFGQLTFFFYNTFLNVAIPYPSVADIGFFGFIPFCIISMICLANTVGAKLSLKSAQGLTVALLIPPALVAVSYMAFLRNYDFAGKNSLTVFLDFGYPIGHSLSISILVITLLFSAKKLGGVMKKKVLLFLVGIILQYIAEFNFIYQNIHLTFSAAHYGDLLYMLAYIVESYALISLVLPGQAPKSAASTTESSQQKVRV